MISYVAVGVVVVMLAAVLGAIRQHDRRVAIAQTCVAPTLYMVALGARIQRGDVLEISASVNGVYPSRSPVGAQERGTVLGFALEPASRPWWWPWPRLVLVDRMTPADETRVV